MVVSCLLLSDTQAEFVELSLTAGAGGLAVSGGQVREFLGNSRFTMFGSRNRQSVEISAAASDNGYFNASRNSVSITALPIEVVPNKAHFIDPTEVGFSQSSVSRVKTRFDLATGNSIRYSFDDIAASMKVNGWQGRPLNVVRMPDGSLTSLDNTRLLAARQAGIKAQIKVHEFDAPISKDFSRAYTAEGRLEPKSWGEAIQSRISIQTHTYYQNRIFPERFSHGSIYDPYLTGGTP